MVGISLSKIQEMRQRFESCEGMRLRMNAVAKSGIDAVSASRESAIANAHIFSHEVKTGKVTSQNASGRCWLFAALNTMRTCVMERCNLETFELSQAYLMFWDKLEKANFFLEAIIETAKEPLDGRLVQWLLAMPFNDGGQWDMVVSLVEKYGVVPKEQYPESFHSSNSGKMNRILTVKGREFAKELRQAAASGKSPEELRGMKEGMLEEFYRILCICLGVPPTGFDFEYRDKDDNFHRVEGLCGKSFYEKFVGRALDEYVSVINAPTADKPYYHVFTVSYLGNVKDGRPIRHLNLPIESLKRAAVEQIKAGEPVWFGCDVGKLCNGDEGVMALDSYDFANLFRTTFGMTKAERLDYAESAMNHAMVFAGVNLADGKPNRWKVENSWGDKRGHEGWYLMSDQWFSEYLYQIVINKKYLTDEERKALDTEVIALSPWDPMGSLA